MTNTFVQAKGVAAAQSGTTGTLAYTSNVTSGNLLCVAFRYNGSGAAHISNITSTRTTGNWTVVYDQSDSGATPIQGGWAYAFATSTGACTVTINFNTSVVGIYMAQDEWNGPLAFRAASAVAVTNETALTSNAATAVAGDLQVAFTTMGAAVTNTITAGSGYNIRAIGISAGGTHFVGTEDKLSSAGGSVTASFTSSENNSGIKATVGLGIFTSVFTISGNAGVAGATVSWSGTASGSTTADGSGNYTTSSLGPGSYTITPSKTGYSFSPSNSSQTITAADITGVNFTATQIVVATPTFSPVAGAYGPSQSVTVSDTDSGLAGFAMYYTTDGSTPTTGSTPYTGAITVSSSLTLKVLATATGYANSNIGSAAYTINGAVATPTFSPVAGSYGPTQSVTISTSTSGASIFYTTDGSTPTSGSTPYTTPVSVSSSLTLKAIATKTDFSDSAVGSAAYTINGAVATPTFSPVAGTYSGTQSVTISSATAGASIFYTTDGSTPTSGSTPYTTPVSVSSSLTVKALATKSNFSDSAIGSAAYVISGGATVYSVPDSRVSPNSSRTVQLTKIYDVQTSSNHSIPPTDSRANVPVDDRATAYVPENSRTPGTYGPGE